MPSEARKTPCGYKWESDLHDLFMRAFPRLCAQNGRLSVPALAEKMEITKACAYKWLDLNKIPARQALRIIALSRGRVALNDFDGLLS